MLLAGVGPKLREHNRDVIEQSVLPGLANDPDGHDVLFIGCHWYTWHYRKFFQEKKYTTLEINPARARYGARDHCVGSAAELPSHFASESLDVILLIGVIGWGLDDVDLIEQTFEGCHDVLRPGGKLVVGCDHVPERMPVDLEQLSSLQKFQPWHFEPLEATTFQCEGDLRHRLDFWRKPINDVGVDAL